MHIDRELLRSIAREFALAINNSEKNVESRRLILFEERSTIARELHDSIAQSLSFSRIQITRLDAALKNKSDEAEVRSILDELKLGVITAYQQLRSVLTTFRLKPKSPDLRENILSSLDEFKERSGIDYTVDNQIQSFELDAKAMSICSIFCGRRSPTWRSILGQPQWKSVLSPWGKEPLKCASQTTDKV